MHKYLLVQILHTPKIYDMYDYYCQSVTRLCANCHRCVFYCVVGVHYWRLHGASIRVCSLDLTLDIDITIVIHMQDACTQFQSR